METTTATETARAARPRFTGCCLPFDPAPWDGKEIQWKDKLFVKEHIRAFFHVPLNMGPTVTRAMAKIRKAGATSDRQLMLSDDASLWGSDLYIEVSKAVPGAKMKRHVTAQRRRLDKLYLGYTTCPACAKAYGKNYVVLLARVGA